MKISTRLLGLSGVGILALAGSGAVGVYGVNGIQEEFRLLSDHTGPLQNELLTLQTSQERVLGDLLALSHSQSTDDAKERRLVVDSELANMDQIATRKADLDPAAQFDTAHIREAFESISDRVDTRLTNIQSVESAAASSVELLLQIDALNASINEGVQALSTEATLKARTAQISANELLDMQRTARQLKSLLDEMTVVMYATDALTSKYRANPLAERWSALQERVSNLTNPDSAAPRLLENLPDFTQIDQAYSNAEQGLLATRLAVLEDQSGAKSTYKRGFKALLADIGRTRNVLSSIIGSLELEIVVENQSVEQMLSLSDTDTSLTSLNQYLTLTVKKLRVSFEELMLGSSSGVLFMANVTASENINQLMTLTDLLAEQFAPLDNDELSTATQQLASDLDQARTSIAQFAKGRQAVLKSEKSLSESLAELQVFAQERRDFGQQRVEAIGVRNQMVTESVDERVQFAVVMIAVISVAGLAGLLMAGLYTSKVIVSRLREAMRVATDVSEGKLHPVTQSPHNDEISTLINTLSTMVSMLDASVRQIRNGSANVNRGIDAINQGNRALRERTELQVQHLDATSASSQQISEGIRESADTLNKASDLSASAHSAASQGRKVVSDAVSTMQEIETGSREINNIVTVIDSIAFQTNILALKAAVEAARAGEAGRGFAVVASEVGQLAQKSKESAHQIGEIINRNVAHVASGATLVTNAGKHMEEAVDSFTEVADFLKDVAVAGQQQVQSMSSISASIVELDEMTRQNQSLSQRTSESAGELHEQARTMDEAVSVFSLSELSATAQITGTNDQTTEQTTEQTDLSDKDESADDSLTSGKGLGALLHSGFKHAKRASRD